MLHVSMKLSKRLSLTTFTSIKISLIYVFIFFVMSIQSAISQNLPDWENLAVFAINTEPAHATFTPFPTEKEALAQAPSSPFVYSLNGDWQFHLADNPDARPEEFYKESYDRSTWQKIPVPADWQFHTKDFPIYTNNVYPFPINPPYVPHDYNPVGSYYRTFDAPHDFRGKQTFLHFAGVNSAFYIWINGEKVGYSEGSKTPAEFDVTKYLREGENTVAVEVYRWSSGSYLEDQDFWRLSGIERDVFLYVMPKVALRDFSVKAIPSKDFAIGNLSNRSRNKKL